MTKDQLYVAAHEYCKLAGLDPDMCMGGTAVVLPADACDSNKSITSWMNDPEWVRVAVNIQRHHNMNEAIRIALLK